MSKGDKIHKLLCRKSGASITQLMKATGWQAHSVRAGLTRLRKSGHIIRRTRSKKGEAVYFATDQEGTV